MSDSNDNILLGVALMIGFCITAPLLDVAAKLAAADIPVGQITTARFVVQGAIMAPICLAMGLGLALARPLWRPVALRALLLILSTYFFVGAIRFMPLADALAIAFVEPFIILLWAKWLFGDEVGPRRLAAAAVGFLGVLLVIQPSFAAFGPVALMPLGTAVCFAAYMLVTRSLSRRMHPVAMQYHTAAMASLICLPVMVLTNGTGWATLDPVMPFGLHWLWLFAVGAFASVSHMFMTYALNYAPSATLAPLHYLEIVSATALGLLIFGDFPNRMALAGIVIIVASGLYVIHRERVTARKARMPLPAEI